MMPNTPGAGPASTPAPLHDIAGPIWFFPYPVWMAIAGGVLLVAILILFGCSKPPSRSWQIINLGSESSSRRAG